MEQIIKNYGRFVLDAVVVALLMVLLFSQITDAEGNRGILNMIGAGIDTGSINYADYTDFNTYVAESSKPAPVITYNGSNSIHAGVARLSDYIKAADRTGAEIAVRVVTLTDQAGTELPCDADTEANFPEAGIYTVRVTAVDDINKRTTSDIRIPVNK